MLILPLVSLFPLPSDLATQKIKDPEGFEILQGLTNYDRLIAPTSYFTFA